MTKVFAIARWEYWEKVKKKSFIASLLIMPLFMFGSIYIPIFFAQNADESPKHFAIVGGDDILDELEVHLSSKYKIQNKKPLYSFVTLTPFKNEVSEQKELAIEKVNSEEFSGYLFLPKTFESNKFEIEFGSKNVSNMSDQERIKSAISEIIFSRKLKTAGYDYSIVKKYKPEIILNTVQVTSQKESKKRGGLEAFFTGYIMNMLMLLLVLTTGQMMVRSLVEEKANKLVEVLLSSCSSKELLTGKILGLSLLGLTMVGFWVLLFIAAMLTSSETFFSADSLNLLISVLYLIFGYFLFASFFISIGSLSSSEQDAQQITGYLTMLIVIPLLLLVPIMQTPNALFVKILSFIPIFTPSIMMLRLSIQTPTVIEIISTLLVLIFSGYGMTILAGKIFHIGILTTGKRPSIKTIISWLKSKD